MRIIYLLFMGILLALLLAIGFAYMTLDMETVRKQIATLSLEHTGKELLLDDLPKFSLSPLGVTFGRATWGYQDGKPAPQGLSCAMDAGSASVELKSLFSGRIKFHEIMFQRPIVTVRPEPSTAKATPAKKKKEGDSSLALELNRFTILAGAIYLEENNRNLVCENVFFQVKDFVMDAQDVSGGTFEGNTVIQTKNPELLGSLLFSGKLTAVPSKVELQNFKLEFLPKKGVIPVAFAPLTFQANMAFNPQSLRGNLSQLSFTTNNLDVQAKGAMHVADPAFQGQVTLNAAPRTLLTLLGLPLPTGKDTFTCSTDIDFNKGQIQFNNINGTLEGCTIAGQLAIQTNKDLAITGNLNLGELTVDTWMPLPNQDAQESSPAASQSWPGLDLKMNIAGLTYDKVRINNLAGHLSGKNGRYTLAPLSGTLASGGTFDTKISANLSQNTYQVSGNAANVAVGELLKSIQNKEPLSGIADLTFDVKTQGLDNAQYIANLAGQGNMTMRDIQLKSISLLPPNAPLPPEKNFSKLGRFDAPFIIASGVVALPDISLSSPSLSAKGNGLISLPEEKLHIQGVISTKGYSLPVVAKGSFDSLSYGLDPSFTQDMLKDSAQIILEQLQKKEAINIGTVLEGLGGILKDKTATPPATTPSQEPTTPASPDSSTPSSVPPMEKETGAAPQQPSPASQKIMENILNSTGLKDKLSPQTQSEIQKAADTLLKDIFKK